MEELNQTSEESTVIALLKALVEDHTSEGLPAKNEFFYYFGLGHVNRAMPKQDPDWKGFGEKGNAFCQRMFIIANDFDNIVTIIHKIHWLSIQWLSGKLPLEHWQAYVSTDIHSFHTELRSIFDSIAIAISNSAVKVNQVPKSFTDLLSYCKKNSQQAKALLGQDLCSLILDTDWFLQNKAFRDQIVHFERDVEIGFCKYGNFCQLFFRTTIGDRPNHIYKGPKKFELGKDGWILYDQYVGYYFGRLWHLLNEVCRIIGANLNLPKSGFNWLHPRLNTALDCITESIKVLDGTTKFAPDC